ncbi:hypothetical protein ACAG96_07165 [Candidatus Izemoplasma sp. B36]|uniref:hypothetical protein n=1 Tax=Candidatus Izemoplasma sp. B36 TaxID=3242468 RepID=UPI0035568B6D
MGVSDYTNEAPLKAIRGLMGGTNGIITIGFKRTKILDGIYKADNELTGESIKISNKWISSTYIHMETAMAYQLGLPIVIIKEKGVIEEGVLEKVSI